MNAEAYILTLHRAVNRRPQVERIVAACPLTCHTLAAVDGAKLSVDEIDVVYRRFLYSPRYSLPLKRGEIGCFLSHRQVWRQIVEGEAEVGLVLEDDIELIQPEFNAALAFALSKIQPGDYIKFQVSDLGAGHPLLHTDGTHSLIQPRVAPLGATSQLITRLAAAQLLEATVTFDRPVDTLIQMTWLTGVPVKVVTPSCVSEISSRLGGSTISLPKSLLNRLYHEFHRPWYRVQIAHLSRRDQRKAS